MKRIISPRRMTAITASICALAGVGAGTAGAEASTNAVTKTFSFIAKPNSFHAEMRQNTAVTAMPVRACGKMMRKMQASSLIDLVNMAAILRPATVPNA